MAQVKAFSLGGLGAPCCCSPTPTPTPTCTPCSIPAVNLSITIVVDFGGGFTQTRGPFVMVVGAGTWITACSDAFLGGSGSIYGLSCPSGTFGEAGYIDPTCSNPTSTCGTDVGGITLQSFTCSPLSIVYFADPSTCNLYFGSLGATYTITL